LTYAEGRFIVTSRVAMEHSLSGVSGGRQPFAGDHVATTGRLTLFSKRDVRVLVERLGGVFSPEITPRTTVIVSAAHFIDPPSTVRRVLDEDEFCREAGLPDLDTLRSRYYAAKDLRAMYPTLREEHLRYMEKWGLIGSVAGRYSFADLHVIRDAVAELERGAALPAVLRALEAERQGQLALDFQPARAPERVPAKVVSLRAVEPAATPAVPSTRAQDIAAANQALAAKYFLEGAELDDGENRDLAAAAGAYRRAALFDPHLVPAVVNLANIYYERDELVEAEALYEKAIRLDPECFEAYFNLGNIHHDLGRYQEALAAYRDALAINPAYPEAHFYLAVTLEKLGRSTDARPHWKQYRDLAPEGEFVALATEFSDTKE
jgi:tetratricopeptide (TPR) repeat protein